MTEYEKYFEYVKPTLDLEINKKIIENPIIRYTPTEDKSKKPITPNKIAIAKNFNYILANGDKTDKTRNLMQPSFNQTYLLYKLIKDHQKLTFPDFITGCEDKLYTGYSSSSHALTINNPDFYREHDDGKRVIVLFNDMVERFNTTHHVSIRLMDGHGRIIVPLLDLISKHLLKPENSEKTVELNIADVISRVNIWHKLLFEKFIVLDRKVRTRIKFVIPRTVVPKTEIFDIQTEEGDIYNSKGDIFRNFGQDDIIYFNFCGITTVCIIRLIQIIYRLNNPTTPRKKKKLSSKKSSKKPSSKKQTGGGGQSDPRDCIIDPYHDENGLVYLCKQEVLDFIKNPYPAFMRGYEAIKEVFEPQQPDPRIIEPYYDENGLVYLCKQEVLDFIEHPIIDWDNQDEDEELEPESDQEQTGGQTQAQSFYLSGSNSFPQERIYNYILFATQEYLTDRLNFPTFRLARFVPDTFNLLIQKRKEKGVFVRVLVFEGERKTVEIKTGKASNTMLLAFIYNYIMKTNDTIVEEYDDIKIFYKYIFRYYFDIYGTVRNTILQKDYKQLMCDGLKQYRNVKRKNKEIRDSQEFKKFEIHVNGLCEE
jgi:hypothetical protein